MAVIAISNDESGISMDPKVRFEVAKRIVERARVVRHPAEDVLIDPLVMPVGAVNTAGRAVLDILRWIDDELGCNTVCGASNVSFGLPDRETINATFLAMLDCGRDDERDHEPAQARAEEGGDGRRHAGWATTRTACGG